MADRERIEGASTSSTTETGSSGVHPIELTVQSIFETPLELLNLNLNSLDESQLILSSILQRLDQKLKNINDNLFDEHISGETNRNGSSGLASKSTLTGSSSKDATVGSNTSNRLPDSGGLSVDNTEEEESGEQERADLSDYLNRISHLKETLDGVNGKLQGVEKRVDNIMTNLNVN